MPTTEGTDLPRNENQTLGAFVKLMRRKLAANAHKGGWENETTTRLMDRLMDEKGELERAIYRLQHCGDVPEMEKKVLREQVALEAADVANFALFLADVCGGLV